MPDSPIRQGGGFCDRHGPFDPPNMVCPYCALEERHKFGPPAEHGPTRRLVEKASSPDSPEELPDAPEEKAQDRSAPEEERAAPEPQLTEQAPLPPDLLETSEEDVLADDVPLPPLAWLVVKEPAALRGTVFPVEPGQVIGREGDIRWADARLSRQHARVTLEPPDVSEGDTALFHLWPFAPKNPVYINGQAIRGATPLSENDEIRLGDTLLVFKVLMD